MSRARGKPDPEARRARELQEDGRCVEEVRRWLRVAEGLTEVERGAGLRAVAEQLLLARNLESELGVDGLDVARDPDLGRRGGLAGAGAEEQQAEEGKRGAQTGGGAAGGFSGTVRFHRLCGRRG